MKLSRGLLYPALCLLAVVVLLPVNARALEDPAVAESFARNLDIVCRQHLVMVNMIRPRGVEPVFTGTPAASVDDLYARLAGHLQWERLRALERVLRRHGVQFSLLNNERLSAELVSQYLQIKRRQLI